MYLFNDFQSSLMAVNQGFDPIGGVQHSVGAQPVPITFNQPNIELYPTQTTGLPSFSDPLSGLTVTTMPLSPASTFNPYTPQATPGDYGAVGLGLLGAGVAASNGNIPGVITSLGAPIMSGSAGEVASDLLNNLTPPPHTYSSGMIDVGMQNVRGQTMPTDAYQEVPVSPTSFTLSSADPYSGLGIGWVDIWG